MLSAAPTLADSDWATRLVPFASATGKGVKVAVVDSGVNLKHPHIQARTHRISWDGDDQFDGDDAVGHGTAVMAAIQERAPGAEYFSLQLFGPSLRASSIRLLQAIDWAISNGMDIINLSLGTCNPDVKAPMQSLLAQAHSQGVLVVAARTDGQREYLPGCLDGAIGVECDWDVPRDRYHITSSQPPVMQLSGYPRSLPGVPPARNLNGVSFAVANATGFLALAREVSGDGSIESIHRLMLEEKQRCS